MKLTGQLVKNGFHAPGNKSHTLGGHKVPRIWIVVAGRKDAHIYRKTLTGVEQIATAQAVHADGCGIHSHGYDERSEKKCHGAGGFAQKLATWLDTAIKEDAFDRLVLIAEPHALGDIRSFLGADVQSCLMAQIDKDLIKLPMRELEDYLREALWF